VGPVIAGVLLAEVGDIQRFRSQDHFASYCGVAPVPWESGASKQVRVNRGGNRRLNWALHLIARTRLRLDAASQALVARKKQEGKTHREAIRILKTYLARQIYSMMLKLLSPEPEPIATY
jgi:transposase